MNEVTPKMKLSRIVAKHPYLKDSLVKMNTEEGKKFLSDLQTRLGSLDYPNKMILIHSDSKISDVPLVHYLLFVYAMRTPAVKFRLEPTYKLLDYYLNESDEHEPLSSLSNENIIISDNNYEVQNKQKQYFITQVFEQNSFCLFTYRGSLSRLVSDLPLLNEYIKDNSIPILDLSTSKKTGRVTRTFDPTGINNEEDF